MFLGLGVAAAVVVVVGRVANLAELRNARDAESQFMRQRKLWVLVRHGIKVASRVENVARSLILPLLLTKMAKFIAKDATGRILVQKVLVTAKAQEH